MNWLETKLAELLENLDSEKPSLVSIADRLEALFTISHLCKQHDLPQYTIDIHAVFAEHPHLKKPYTRWVLHNLASAKIMAEYPYLQSHSTGLLSDDADFEEYYQELENLKKVCVDQIQTGHKKYHDNSNALQRESDIFRQRMSYLKSIITEAQRTNSNFAAFVERIFSAIINNQSFNISPVYFFRPLLELELPAGVNFNERHWFVDDRNLDLSLLSAVFYSFMRKLSIGENPRVEHYITWATLLLQHGADINFPDSEGKTILEKCVTEAIDIAKARRDINSEKLCLQIIEFLLQKDADTEASNNVSRRTPLLVAAQADAKNLVALLMKYGANDDAKDRDGLTLMGHTHNAPNVTNYLNSTTLLQVQRYQQKRKERLNELSGRRIKSEELSAADASSSTQAESLYPILKNSEDNPATALYQAILEGNKTTHEKEIELRQFFDILSILGLREYSIELLTGPLAQSQREQVIIASLKRSCVACVNRKRDAPYLISYLRMNNLFKADQSLLSPLNKEDRAYFRDMCHNNVNLIEDNRLFSLNDYSDLLFQTFLFLQKKEEEEGYSFTGLTSYVLIWNSLKHLTAELQLKLANDICQETLLKLNSAYQRGDDDYRTNIIKGRLWKCLELGANPNHALASALRIASDYGDIAFLKELLEQDDIALSNNFSLLPLLQKRQKSLEGISGWGTDFFGMNEEANQYFECIQLLCDKFPILLGTHVDVGNKPMTLREWAEKHDDPKLKQYVEGKLGIVKNGLSKGKEKEDRQKEQGLLYRNIKKTFLASSATNSVTPGYAAPSAANSVAPGYPTPSAPEVRTPTTGTTTAFTQPSVATNHFAHMSSAAQKQRDDEQKRLTEEHARAALANGIPSALKEPIDETASRVANNDAAKKSASCVAGSSLS